MSTTAKGSARRLTLLISCAGRRVELVQAFRAAARRLNVRLRLVGTDCSPTAPALACVDEPVLVPRVDSPDYVATMLDVVRRCQVRAVVPTTDPDLPVLSRHREQFEPLGCTVLVAEPEVIDICRDKIRTSEHLRAAGIDTPATFTPEQIRSSGSPAFPCFIKPRFGSASLGARKIEDQQDLDYYLARVPDPIVQEFVEGVEHTLDVYVGLSGQPRCVVPRRRWAVRGGEVAKGVVVKDRAIMQAGRRVAESLGDSARGLLTLQCIVTSQGRISFIEINPRFGGGAPLGIAAGADYPGWLIRELLGETPQVAFDGFRHGLCMLRYDWSVFVALDDDLKPRIRPPLRPAPPFA